MPHQFKAFKSWIKCQNNLKRAQNHLCFEINSWMWVILSDESKFWDRITYLKVCSTEFLGEALSRLYKWLQAFKLKLSYSTENIYDTMDIYLRKLKKMAKQITKEKIIESITSTDYIDQSFKFCSKL